MSKIKVLDKINYTILDDNSMNVKYWRITVAPTRPPNLPLVSDKNRDDKYDLGNVFWRFWPVIII